MVFTGLSLPFSFAANSGLQEALLYVLFVFFFFKTLSFWLPFLQPAQLQGSQLAYYVLFLACCPPGPGFHTFSVLMCQPPRDRRVSAIAMPGPKRTPFLQILSAEGTNGAYSHTKAHAGLQALSVPMAPLSSSHPTSYPKLLQLEKFPSPSFSWASHPPVSRSYTTLHFSLTCS